MRFRKENGVIVEGVLKFIALSVDSYRQTSPSYRSAAKSG